MNGGDKDFNLKTSEQMHMVLDFIRANPIAFSQVILSMALVIATFAYTIYTKRQTDEMQKTRKTSNQPVLQGSLVIPASTLVMAEFQNTGNGAAHNVSASVYFEDIEVEPMEFTLPMVSPEDAHRFTLPVDDSMRESVKIDDVEAKLNSQNSDGKLVFSFECQNPFGDSYTYENSVNVLDWLDNSPSVVNFSEETKARKAIEGIESGVEDISDKLS